MSELDLAVILVYFVGVALIGFWSSRHSRDDSRSYFLAGGNIGWMAVGASLFATNISAEHFIGLAGTAANSGLAVGQFEWLACFMLLILGWLFVPFYHRTGVFTMPEFLEQRFNRQCRTYLSTVSMIAYVFTKISVSLYAGAKVLEAVLGWNIYVGAIVLVLSTGVYTLFGGLRAVIFTDFFQAFILIGGGIVLTGIAIHRIDGVHGLLSHVDPEFFNIWKGVSHAEFPWTGIMIGAPIIGVWYWCTDQVIVQRTLAAKSIGEARRAAIFAGYLKILPVFILVLPGIAGRVLFPDVEPDKMYATMVSELLPSGIKGLVIAALLAALMSSLSSVFNSSSTLVVIDFYKHWRPAASEKELVRAGQAATCALVVVGIAWLPFIGIMSNQLYVYLQSVQAYVSPPIAAVFLLGVLNRRVNGAGAFATLIVGFCLGAGRFFAELGVKAGMLTSSPFVWFAGINFLHFAILLFVVSVAVMVGVSAMTRPPTEANLSIFTRRATPDIHHEVDTASNGVNIALSLFLAAIVITLWVICSPLFFH